MDGVKTPLLLRALRNTSSAQQGKQHEPQAEAGVGRQRGGSRGRIQGPRSVGARRGVAGAAAEESSCSGSEDEETISSAGCDDDDTSRGLLRNRQGCRVRVTRGAAGRGKATSERARAASRRKAAKEEGESESSFIGGSENAKPRNPCVTSDGPESSLSSSQSVSSDSSSEPMLKHSRATGMRRGRAKGGGRGRPRTSPAAPNQNGGNSKSVPRGGRSNGTRAGQKKKVEGRPGGSVRHQTGEMEANEDGSSFWWSERRLDALRVAMTEYNPLEGERYWQKVSLDVPGLPSAAECRSKAIREEEDRLELQIRSQKKSEQRKEAQRLKAIASQPLKGHTKDWKMTQLMHATSFNKAGASDDIFSEMRQRIKQSEVELSKGDSSSAREGGEKQTQDVHMKSNSNDAILVADVGESQSSTLAPPASHTGDVSEGSPSFYSPADVLPRPPRRLSAAAARNSELTRRVSVGSASADAAAATAAGLRSRREMASSEPPGSAEALSASASVPPVTPSRQATVEPNARQGGGGLDWTVMSPGQMEMLRGIHTGFTPNPSATGTPNSVHDGGFSVQAGRHSCSPKEDRRSLSDAEGGSGVPRNDDLLDGLEAPRSFLQDRFLKQHKKQLSKIRKNRDVNKDDATFDGVGRRGRAQHVGRRRGRRESLSDMLAAKESEKGQDSKALKEALQWEAEHGATEADRRLAAAELRGIEFEGHEDEDDEDDGNPFDDTSGDE